MADQNYFKLALARLLVSTWARDCMRMLQRRICSGTMRISNLSFSVQDMISYNAVLAACEAFA